MLSEIVVINDSLQTFENEADIGKRVGELKQAGALPEVCVSNSLERCLIYSRLPEGKIVANEMGGGQSRKGWGIVANELESGKVANEMG